MVTKLSIGALAMAAAAAQDYLGSSEAALVTERIRRLGTKHVEEDALSTIRDWMERVNPELLPYDVEERRRISTADYEKISSAGDCCRNNDAEIGRVADREADSPADCVDACNDNPDCKFFSHSNEWQNCVLCSKCDFSGAPGNGRHYTSWEKQTGEKQTEARFSIQPKTGCNGQSTQVSDAAKCKQAAEGLGKRYWGGSGHSSGADPKGCIFRTLDNDVYFNTHATGSLNGGDRKLVCEGNDLETAGETGTDLENAGEDCWTHCDQKSGPCDWCGSGLCCRKGWEGGENGCEVDEGFETFHGCVAGTPDKAAPSSTPAPAPKRDLTPGSWTKIDRGCINGHELKKYIGKSLEQCKALCTKDPKCQSVEYGANHKENAEFKPKDCQLNSSRDPANCDGGAKNSDLYLAPRVPVDVDAIETPTLSEEQEKQFEKMNGLLGEFKEIAGSPEYCWRGSYTRDAGRFGSECPSDKERVGLIGLWCYDKCPKGYSRLSVDGVALDATCYQDCPDGFIDSGVACTIMDMEDDFGYLREQKCHNVFRGEWPWDPTTGPLGRCEEAYGKGNCEWSGVSPTGNCYTPKCTSAPEKHVKYTAVGLWCRPTVDCPSMDMINGFQITGKTCTKQPPQLWPGIDTTGCASGTERSGALCYNKCKSGFKGNAFVCWEQAPKGWTECGMGAAKDEWTCASVTGGQVFAVGQLAYTIGSMGAGALGNTAANAANPGLIQQAKDLVLALKEWLQISKEMEQAASTIMEVGGVAWNAHAAASHDLFQTEEDVVRFIAKLTKIFDGTGISSTIAAYTYPQCSKYGLRG